MIFYTTEQAKGALPNWTRVRKINSKEDDTHKDGALATIIGSSGPLDVAALASPLPPEAAGKPLYVYWVIWDDVPGLPVGIAGFRVEAVDG